MATGKKLILRPESNIANMVVIVQDIFIWVLNSSSELLRLISSEI